MDLFQGLSLGNSVTSFQTNTNSAMRGVRSNNLTPADITTVNMKQGVALKTSRDVGVSGVITNYRSTAVEQLDGIIGGLSGGLLNTKDLLGAIRVGPSGVTFSVDSIIKAVAGDVGINLGGSAGATRQLNNVLAQEFSAITGLNISGLLTSSGQPFRTNPNWRNTVGQQTIRMYGKAASTDDLMDTSVKGAFYNSVLKSSVSLGMSDSLSNIWNAYPLGFDAVRKDAALEAMQIIISNGDIITMNAMLALFDTATKTTLLSKYPTFVADLFSKFTFDKSAMPEDYPVLRDTLLTILNDLVGPHWYLTQTNFTGFHGGMVLNMGLVNKASPDMITLLQTWDEIVPLLCCAGTFTDGTATAQLKSLFPGAPQYAF